MAKFNSDSWIGVLEGALGPLVESVTADRWGGPPLTNDQYRELGERANVDPNARGSRSGRRLAIRTSALVTMMKHQKNSPKSNSALASLPQLSIGPPQKERAGYGRLPH